MTGIHSGSQSKKRKHRSTEDVDSSVSQKKKEKRHKTSVAPPLQDALKRKPVSSKDKGKSRASEDLPSEFRTINASLVLSVPPVFASDLRAGVEEMLDSMVMRYIPSLQGVLLAHSNIQFLSQTANIHGDCPFAVCNVSFDATVWGPRVSMKLVGRINLYSPDHVSLLVHRTFNVSIPRQHIPQDQWVFEYGPAPNDPEFGEGTDWNAGGQSKDAESDAEMVDSTQQKTSQETREAESSGRWVHHLTGSKLGDPDGYVEFTVIGLTIANEMLSLQGSIQPDPFSPEHVPHPNKEPSPAFARDGTSDVEDHHEGDRADKEDEDEDESDGDTFRYLAKLSDEARAAQEAKRAQEEGERVDALRYLAEFSDEDRAAQEAKRAQEAERVENGKKRKRRESRGKGGESKRAEKKRIKETSP
ncbi:hypothetical protein JVU11DRAFT_2782 [Chiua virens]|nr:hypothetical protein JVU11DRAFT_2782 [Chiua virens]